MFSLGRLRLGPGWITTRDAVKSFRLKAKIGLTEFIRSCAGGGATPREVAYLVQEKMGIKMTERDHIRLVKIREKIKPRN